MDFVQVAIMKHVTYTGSRYAEGLLADWAALQQRIVKVMPREYKRVLAAEAQKRASVEVIAVPASSRAKGKKRVLKDAGVSTSSERRPQA